MCARRSLNVNLEEYRNDDGLLPLIINSISSLLNGSVVLKVSRLRAGFTLLTVSRVGATVGNRVMLRVLLRTRARRATILRANLLLAHANALRDCVVEITIRNELRIVRNCVARYVPSRRTL